MIFDLDKMKACLDSVATPVCRGRTTEAHEIVIGAELPGARVGMRVMVSPPTAPPVMAEVVACSGTHVQLLPLMRTVGIGPGQTVTGVAHEGRVPAGKGLLGRVVDTLGIPLDGGPSIGDAVPWPITRQAPDPLLRRPIDEQLVTGIRVLDGCFGLGLGQRVGLFAGPGLGKSTLLGTLVKRAKSDINVVCLVGERGREVLAFIERFLSDERRSRSVIVLSRADDPLMHRVRALDAATAIAEWFRQCGHHVLLLVDSLTRVIRARRDVAFALGEPPARGGFPASAFASLPALMERTGRAETGSITAIYAVLTEGKQDDPVAEEARSLLDGHLVLSEKLAHRGQWPAVDILRSISRVADAVVPADVYRASERLRSLLSAYEDHEDLMLMGAYRRGTSPDTDFAFDHQEEIASFLQQPGDEASPLHETHQRLLKLVGGR